jgi:hypothetical protein
MHPLQMCDRPLQPNPIIEVAVVRDRAAVAHFLSRCASA